MDKHVGGPSAKDCPWFTDNPLLKYARQPWNQTQYELDTGKTWTYGQDPSVVRIDCGSFTGTYTINEDDDYAWLGVETGRGDGVPADATPSQVWFKDYAWVMNLMCAIPIFGIVRFPRGRERTSFDAVARRRRRGLGSEKRSVQFSRPVEISRGFITQVMLVWLIANHEHVTCFNRKKVRDWAASAQRRGSNVDLAARAEAQAETTESRCGGCLCCCGPRPDVLVEHEAQREARIAAHRGVLPGLEPGDA